MENVTITARDGGQKLTGQIHLGKEEITMKSKRLRILDASNRSLLYADKDKLEINVKGVEFIGERIIWLYD